MIVSMMNFSDVGKAAAKIRKISRGNHCEMKVFKSKHCENIEGTENR